MPTPFSHLVVAARLLADMRLPDEMRAALAGTRSAFLLGNIAADARISSGMQRENTHFYAYDRPIRAHPWRVMLDQHPTLLHPASADQRAFVAGYVAHLAMDEAWSIQLVRPYFGQGQWETPQERFFLLNALLVALDARDYLQIDGWQRDVLLAAAPQGWAPFMADEDLSDWRDFVGEQLPPSGHSQTLAVIGERIGLTPSELAAFVQSEQAMSPLWQNVPPEKVRQVEGEMMEHAQRDLLAYWHESAPGREGRE